MKVSLLLAVAAAITGVSANDFYGELDGVYVPRLSFLAEDDLNLWDELKPLRNDGKHLPEIDFHRLNLGLYFEYIELALFDEGIRKFSQDDWEQAGYREIYRKLVGYMRDQAIGHAAAVQTILQGRGGGPCRYRFPYHDVKSFVELCSQVTTVGEAGYLGFTWQLHNPENRLTSYQIFATEARQNAKFRAAQGLNPLNSFFDTPLTESQAYTLAAQLVEECPSENPKIPFKRFPRLEAEVVGYGTLKLKFDIKTADEYGKHASYESDHKDPNYNSSDEPNGHGHNDKHKRRGHDGSDNEHDGSKGDHSGHGHNDKHKSRGHDGSDDEHKGSKGDHKDDSHKSSSSESSSDSDDSDEGKHHLERRGYNDEQKDKHCDGGSCGESSSKHCTDGKSRSCGEGSSKDCTDDKSGGCGEKPKLYVAWINQIGVTYTDFDVESSSTNIPLGQSGATFVAITTTNRCNDDCRFVPDFTIVAGPAFVPAIPGDFLGSD